MPNADDQQEADLGDGARRRLFETADEKDHGPEHREGAGQDLFDKTHLDEQVKGWHGGSGRKLVCEHLT